VLLLSKLLLSWGVGCSNKKKRRKLPLCSVGQAREMASNCRPSLQQAAGVSAQLSSAPSLQCASQSREGKKRKEGKRPFLTTNKQTKEAWAWL
jgi:hypothetical protein